MRELVTTCLELVGVAALILGSYLLAGLGWALVFVGTVCIGASWAMNGMPRPGGRR